MVKTIEWCSTAISRSETMYHPHITMALKIARILLIFSQLWGRAKTCLMAATMLKSILVITTGKQFIATVQMFLGANQCITNTLPWH